MRSPPLAWQLGIAFVGVTVLAVTANFAVQRTISITTTHVVPAAPLAATTVGGGAIADESTLARRAMGSLDRLRDAVDAGVHVPVAERQRRVRIAAEEVRAALGRLHGEESQRRMDEARGLAVRLVDISSIRRRHYEEYAAILGPIGMELQQSLDGAWRIFGRVVARQSLVAMNEAFNQMQQQAGVLGDGHYPASEAQQLQVLEERFAATLSEGGRARRRQSPEEGASIQERFARAREASASLIAIDAERATALSRFRASVTAVREELARPPAARLLYPAGSQADALPGEAAPMFSRSEQARDEGIGRTGLAWLSAGVLGLLLAVSVLAVLSILRPVQRLIRATKRLSRGEAGVRVPGGGARELERLGAAFNLMAEQLEEAQGVARSYQQQLESRVAERTCQLQYQADHDALTQLPNRRQLFEHLREVLARAPDGSGAALFFIDLDNFKNINDGMGHGFGDQVLVAIAGRLTRLLGQRGRAARFGGDEFTVVVDRPAEGESLCDLGWSLVRAFQEPLRVEGREVLVSVSVGAAFCPEHGHDAESLLRAADAALFRAKALGRSQLSVFTPELLEAAASRFAIEQGLRQAVDRDELELAFQPELDLDSCRIEVVEALLRWRDAQGRRLLPQDFLSVAEESGLITEINDWVLRSAIAAVARWRRAGHCALRVAINVSSRQLIDPGFPGRVRDLLREHDVPPSALEIELTETVLQTGASTIEGLRRLQHLGVMVALDDFGAGYSSLASLECLPLDRVKLDRSLIAGIDTSARSVAIARAIIRLARDLGVRITAEGVERCSQLAVLRGEQLLVQGYLLSRPVAEGQLADVLQDLPGRLQSLLADIAPVAEDTQRRRRLRLASASR
jgi:diguanylate cyclase (GGDEF)-like protein